jgi:hypothetical protein
MSVGPFESLGQEIERNSAKRGEFASAIRCRPLGYKRFDLRASAVPIAPVELRFDAFNYRQSVEFQPCVIQIEDATQLLVEFTVV